MGFVFPAFLFALVLIAIPVFIHLFNFRKFKKVYFSNVSFLKDLQIETAASQRLKERLILFCRIMAIVFLVLAFAQPFWKTSKSTPTYQQSLVSIYLDNSYSMEAVNKNGTLLDEGKRKVKDLADAYGLNDRFQLLTNDFNAKSQQALSKSELLDALNDVKVSPWFRDYHSIVAEQQRFLAKNPRSNKTAYVISDFQKQKASKESFENDAAVQFILLPLVANELPNLSVDSVYFLSPVHQAKQKESLVYKLSNHSAKDVEHVPVSLKINNNQKAIATVSLKANASVLDTLHFSDLSGSWQRATLSIQDYPITFDDNLNFAFEVKQSAAVLGIYEDQPIKNIQLAYQTDDFFRFKAVNQSQINYSDFANQQAIILENLKQISSGLAQQLKQYVSNGGNLSVFIPLQADLASYASFLNALKTDIPLSLEKEENKVDRLNLSHPIFNDVFDGQPERINLPVAKQYFKSSNLSKTSRQILLYGRTADNLFSTYQLGKGNIYLSFLPLEQEGSNFAYHAVFLPILFKSALLGNSALSLFYTLGKDQSVPLSSELAAGVETLNIKGEGADIIPSYQRNPAGGSIYFADQLQKPGFYEVFAKDSLISVFGLNENRDESALVFYKQTELKELFPFSNVSIIQSRNKITTQQIKEVNFGTSLWKVCLILTLIFLAAEVLLIRFHKNRYVKSKPTIN